MNVLIFGSSGLTGTELLKQLSQLSTINEIHLAVRVPIKTNHLKNVQQHIVDFTSHEHIDSLFEQNYITHVFCALGTTIKKAGNQAAFKAVDVDLISSIGKVAISNKSVKKFTVISALGADANSPVFYNQCKGETENNLIQYLERINAELIQGNETEKQLIICRPSLLTGERDEFRFGEKIGIVLSKCTPFLFSGKFKKYQPIHAKTLASAMIHASINKPLNRPVNILENNELHALGHQ